MTDHPVPTQPDEAHEQLARDARIHYVLGLCNTWRDHRKAAYHFRRFLELDPDAPEADVARDLLRVVEMVQD